MVQQVVHVWESEGNILKSDIQVIGILKKYLGLMHLR
jgi:hypothetical protein